MVALCAGLAAPAVFAQDRGVSGNDTKLYPGNLVVSRSLYDNRASNVSLAEILPPNCQSISGYFEISIFLTFGSKLLLAMYHEAW